MSVVRIGDRSVGDGAPCFITFEAGPTHSGLESAKRLVTLAADAGADAVKFQVVDPDRLVSDKKLLFTYDVLVDRQTGATETVTEPLYDILRRRTLSAAEWREVKRHSDSLNLAFFATAAFDDEIELLADLGCQSVKIASADINHLPLIRRAARTGMCIQIDTGSATFDEIELAMAAIYSEGNERVIIHQCPSGYPARLESINLRMIATLKEMYSCPVAFSDHTAGWDMDVAAVVLGANLVEKTITEDRTTRSVEHVFSLEANDMRRFVQAMRDIEKALGQPRRTLTAEEQRYRLRYRRSIHARRDLPSRHVLIESDFEYRRPGDGIPPAAVESLVGRCLRVAKCAGERIEWGDLDTVDKKE